jgi:hypothetical protein
MSTHQFDTAMTAICKDVIATVGDVPSDTPAQRAVRQQAVADTMVSLMPRNPVDAMLAGQCLVFDRLVHEAARELLRGQPDEDKLRARPQICSSAKIFLAQLSHFERRQARAADETQARRDAETPAARPDAATRATQPEQPAAVPTESAAANPDQRPAPAPRQRTEPAPSPLAAAPGPAMRDANRIPPNAKPASAPADATQPSPAFAAERELAQILSRLDPTDPGFDDGVADAYRVSQVPAASQTGTVTSRRDPGSHANGAGVSPGSAPGSADSSRQAARVKELV